MIGTPSPTFNVTWELFHQDCDKLRDVIDRHFPFVRSLYGIPTGGSFVAHTLAAVMGLPMLDYAMGNDGEPVKDPNTILIVDDLIDSGRTMEAYGRFPHKAVLYKKPHSPDYSIVFARRVDGWVKFPWEHDSCPEDAVTRLLEYIGEDPNRDGLKDTPKRVCKALKEMTSGYEQKPSEILATKFRLDHDELVLLKDVPFTSLCEHHMLPFSGKAHVVYIPDGGMVVGLSKLARLVQAFARRLQIQERMTSDIADSINDVLQPVGAACIIEAEHSCLGCRGARLPGAKFVTSALRGVFRNDQAARAELMNLLGAR